ncbi:hypothetical protein [Mesobacillus foraminis]|uniref:Uncharacterized protein n=1 Tax=Mesobacillus foraminis TaxID=279826 RepID=A0A4R2BBY7_9BACI|nr:hypothetical protein [Mesobacillus foraminis]TCN24437.1 hypothetical protein EV146_107132 [Mesobacillus foraminis]
MDKNPEKGYQSYAYDDQGTMEVSRQIMNSYNSGVIDPSEMRRIAEQREEE